MEPLSFSPCHGYVPDGHFPQAIFLFDSHNSLARTLGRDTGTPPDLQVIGAQKTRAWESMRVCLLVVSSGLSSPIGLIHMHLPPLPQSCWQ